jgi:dienelactone hydrolase
MPAKDPLSDFDRATFTDAGVTRTVFRRGTGPAVIVIPEMPGITPEVADFARRVVAAGFTAVMPSLFGGPGRPMTLPYVARSLFSGCVSRDFATFALDRTSPITTWLCALARDVHGAAGGPGVGVVGMCFTGGFALGMTVDETVLAPVLSQPSLPFPVGRARRAATGVSRTDLDAVKRRAEQGVCVLGLRFTGDVAVPAARFETLRRELGDAFIGVEIDSSRGNPHGIKARAHSVLTLDLVDDAGHPTRDALDQVLDFLRTRLTPERESS